MGSSVRSAIRGQPGRVAHVTLCSLFPADSMTGGAAGTAVTARRRSRCAGCSACMQVPRWCRRGGPGGVHGRRPARGGQAADRRVAGHRVRADRAAAARHDVRDPAWRLLAPGELLHVGPDLGIGSSSPFPAEPRHLLRLADLDAAAATSQHPALDLAGCAGPPGLRAPGPRAIPAAIQHESPTVRRCGAGQARQAGAAAAVPVRGAVASVLTDASHDPRACPPGTGFISCRARRADVPGLAAFSVVFAENAAKVRRSYAGPRRTRHLERGTHFGTRPGVLRRRFMAGVPVPAGAGAAGASNFAVWPPPATTPSSNTALSPSTCAISSAVA